MAGSLYTQTYYCNSDNSVTGPAAQLANTTDAPGIREVVVQADPSNTANIKIGNATTQAIVLSAGNSIVIPCSDIATIFRVAVAGTQTVNWLARSIPSEIR